MTPIEPRTVLLLTGIMGGLMSLVMYGLKRSYPASIKGLGEWSGALLILFVGGILVAGRARLPDLVAISVSSLLLWLGVYVMFRGTQRFFGVTPNALPWLICIAAMSGVQVWFTLVQPSYHMRLILTTLFVSGLSGAHAWLIFRQRPLSPAQGLALGVLLFLTAAQIVRLVTSFSDSFPVSIEFFDTSGLQLFYIASFSFALLLFAISAVLMATERLRIELERIANHDSLTHAFTRRHMDTGCQVELSRCRRHGRNMAVLMLDLDHFKKINDTYGHPVGDQTLIRFVTQVSTLLRQPDMLGRYGGEEFLLLLPDISEATALVVAERIRVACEQTQTEPRFTVSIGLTTIQANSDTVATLTARADQALYRAKAQGRNRVEAA